MLYNKYLKPRKAVKDKRGVTGVVEAVKEVMETICVVVKPVGAMETKVLRVPYMST